LWKKSFFYYDNNLTCSRLMFMYHCRFWKCKHRQSFFDDDDKANRLWIIISPKIAEWDTVNGFSRGIHSWTVIPLWLSGLSYVCTTTWKLQVQTIRNKTVIVLKKNKEKDHGLTYTTFSQVTKTSNIRIDRGFTCNK